MYAKPKDAVLYFFLGVLFGLGAPGCSMLGGATDLERAHGYHFVAPDDWSRQNRGESDQAFRLPSGNLVTVVSSCNQNPDAPLEVLTNHLLMGTRGDKIKSREKRKFGDNEGLYSQVVAGYQGKPFYLELFVFSKNKCVFDFSLMGPKEIPESDSREFQQFVASFSYGN